MLSATPTGQPVATGQRLGDLIARGAQGQPGDDESGALSETGYWESFGWWLNC